MVFGLGGVGMARTDVTKIRVTGSTKDIDGGVLPGMTIAVKSPNKPLGGF